MDQNQNQEFELLNSDAFVIISTAILQFFE